MNIKRGIEAFGQWLKRTNQHASLEQRQRELLERIAERLHDAPAGRGEVPSGEGAHRRATMERGPRRGVATSWHHRSDEEDE